MEPLRRNGPVHCKSGAWKQVERAHTNPRVSLKQQHQKSLELDHEEQVSGHFR